MNKSRVLFDDIFDLRIMKAYEICPCNIQINNHKKCDK